MTIAVAYKTTRPDLIADYLAKREVEVAEFNAKTDAFKATIGGRVLFGTAFYDGGHSIEGYRAEKYGEDLPVGWRFNGARLDVVPAKRTPEGKEIAKQLRGLYLRGNTYPGVPNMLFTEGFSIFPGVKKIGEDYYLMLSKTPSSDSRNDIDPSIWEPVKLSAYFAAVEAEAEQQP